MNQDSKERNYVVVCYVKIEPENLEFLDFGEAKKEVENLKLMQPENIYRIGSLDPDEMTTSPLFRSDMKGWCPDSDKAFDLHCQNLGCEDWCDDGSNCPIRKE